MKKINKIEKLNVTYYNYKQYIRYTYEKNTWNFIEIPKDLIT